MPPGRSRSSFLSGKTAVLYGTRGLGVQAAQGLATHGLATLVVVASDEATAAFLKQSLAWCQQAKGVAGVKTELRFLVVDELSMRDVRRVAAEIAAMSQVDVLWLNTPALLEPATAKTEEGYEHTFARAVWSLCLVLAPVLPQSLAEQARIVITCGPGGDLCNWKLDFESLEKAPDPRKAYAQASVCQTLLSVELAERLTLQHRNVTVNCFHPGALPGSAVSQQALYTCWGAKAAQRAAELGVYLCFNPGLEEATGCYFTWRRLLWPPGARRPATQDPRGDVADPMSRAKFWTRAEELLRVQLAPARMLDKDLRELGRELGYQPTAQVDQMAQLSKAMSQFSVPAISQISVDKITAGENAKLGGDLMRC